MTIINVIMFYHYSHYHVLNIITIFTTIVIMIVLPFWCCFRRIIDVQKIITSQKMQVTMSLFITSMATIGLSIR